MEVRLKIMKIPRNLLGNPGILSSHKNGNSVFVTSLLYYMNEYFLNAGFRKNHPDSSIPITVVRRRRSGTPCNSMSVVHRRCVFMNFSVK